MKKLLSTSMIMGLVVLPAFGAGKMVPSHIAKDGRGGYDVTYSYKDKAKTGWYATARAELSLLNFKNKYSSDENWWANEDFNNDKYSFEPVFGGSIAGGVKINYFWRAELELGYLGYFSDEDDLAKFKMSLPYLMAAGYYDFTNGLYLGAGLGASLAHYEWSGAVFNDFSKDKTTVSPMLALMLGYTYKLDDNMVLDLRYRLAGLTGAEVKLDFQDAEDASHWFKSKTGMILDNSISLGFRYEF